MHILGAKVLKAMHPAANMCTPGAGCTLDFENTEIIQDLKGFRFMIPPFMIVHHPNTQIKSTCGR